MPPSTHSTSEKDTEKIQEAYRYDPNAEDQDAQFGGTEARRVLEKKLLWKVDLRMSVMVVIYILNYVRIWRLCHDISLRHSFILVADRSEQCWVSGNFKVVKLAMTWLQSRETARV
jgi:hypothetical protein